MDSRPISRLDPNPHRRRSPWTRVPVVVLLALALILLIVTVAVAFSDVPASHPYAEAIQTLTDRGIINGFPDGTFRPDGPVLRQQFAKMIVLTLVLPVSESDVVPFGDVQIDGYPDPFYPDNYIAVAAAHGITVGTGPGTFSPAATILRAQVVTMIVRAAQNELPGGTLATPPTNYTGTVPDFGGVHAPNMRIAEFNDLLNGLVGLGPSWDPFKPASRGEVAQMLANLIALMESSGSTTTSSSSTTSSSTTSTTDDSTNRVRIDNFAFTPATLNAAVGATVTWRNDDNVTHTVTADDGVSFASPNIPPGGTFSHTFNTPGVFAYHCSIHPSMHGTINVQ